MNHNEKRMRRNGEVMKIESSTGKESFDWESSRASARLEISRLDYVVYTSKEEIAELAVHFRLHNPSAVES